MPTFTPAPQEAFDQYLLGLDVADEAARLVIATPGHLPEFLRWDENWDVPANRPTEGPYSTLRPPHGTWQEDVLTRPKPRLDILIGDAALHQLREERGPEGAAIGFEYLRGVAYRRSVTMRMVGGSALAMRSNGFAGLMTGKIANSNFGEGVWLGDARDELLYRPIPHQAAFYTEVARSLRPMTADNTHRLLREAAAAARDSRAWVDFTNTYNI